MNTFYRRPFETQLVQSELSQTLFSCIPHPPKQPHLVCPSFVGLTQKQFHVWIDQPEMIRIAITFVTPAYSAKSTIWSSKLVIRLGALKYGKQNWQCSKKYGIWDQLSTTECMSNSNTDLCCSCWSLVAFNSILILSFSRYFHCFCCVFSTITLI